MYEHPYAQSAQTLQDQIGQLSKLLGGQAKPQEQYQVNTTPAESRFDIVNGLEGARKTLQGMLAGTKHIVWDSERDAFYVLQKDSNGQAMRIKICPYTVELEPTMEDLYVTKEDFNVLVSRIDSLLAQREVTSNG